MKSEFNFREEIHRPGAFTQLGQLGQNTAEVLGGIVNVDGGLILPDLDERQRCGIANLLVEGIRVE